MTNDSSCRVTWLSFVVGQVNGAHGYSLFPDLVLGRITVRQTASASESLRIIFAGAAVVLPVIIGYTVFSYRVFCSKARALSYG
jgi:cytochrome bd-type quinol oxidase subunit 2